MTAYSKRFNWYFPLFAVLFAAFSVQPLLNGLRYGIKEDAKQSPSVVNVRWREYAVLSVLVLSLCFELYSNVQQTRRDITASAPHERYAAAMEWIQQNVHAGEVIFNSDWDDFPPMFYYNSSNAYVSGLDPTYLLDADAERARLYERITLGDERKLAPLIRESFGASYIFVKKQERPTNFYLNIEESGDFEEVYSDSYCTIFRIKT